MYVACCYIQGEPKVYALKYENLLTSKNLIRIKIVDHARAVLAFFKDEETTKEGS